MLLSILSYVFSFSGFFLSFFDSQKDTSFRLAVIGFLFLFWAHITDKQKHPASDLQKDLKECQTQIEKINGRLHNDSAKFVGLELELKILKAAQK